MGLPVTTVLLMTLCAVMLQMGQGTQCPISLPHNVPRDSSCYKTRQASLAKQRVTYGIRKPTPAMPFSRLDMSIPEFIAFLATNPFLGFHAKLWIGLAKANKLVVKGYLNKTNALPKILQLPEFAPLAQFFKISMKKYFNGYVKHPSSVEPFQTDMTKWISDQHFAEQRLAGINPFTLQKVTFSTEIGINWNYLKKKLNQEFNWEKAFRRAIRKYMWGKSMNWAIEHGYVYVLYHPLNDNINSMPDLLENDPHRRMWNYLSPITLFVSAPGKHPFFKSRLIPLAIQMDSNPEANVYTPNDGDLWMLAKLNVQLTDMENSQLVEHLSKCHFVTEAICLSIERQLSKRHPLYAAMKYHCRGILITNFFGGPTLLSPQQTVDQLYEYGYKGSNFLVREISKILHWNDLDFESDLKKRGVDDYRRLPYFPYRDDGDEVHAVINDMAADYVDTYYHANSDVTEDNELQNFVNEVSGEGTGPSGGKGKLRGFPAKIENKQQLVKLFTQMIWLMSGRHASVNYPLADYASYIPNMPVKLYDDDRVDNATFSTARLPNREITTEQVGTHMVLGSLRYDRLFDYGVFLDDPKGREVLYRYFSVLTEEVEPILNERNKRRLEDGHLTYPYMLPKWLTNGIQT